MAKKDFGFNMAVRYPLQKIKPDRFYCGSPAVYRKSFRWSNTIRAKHEKNSLRRPPGALTEKMLRRAARIFGFGLGFGEGAGYSVTL
jgi:hypothetical protein